MRKINRVKRRKIGVGAVVAASVFCVAIWENGAAANENGGLKPNLEANAGTPSNASEENVGASVAKAEGVDGAAEKQGREETAEVGGNKENGEIATRSKTPILRDEPTSTTRNGGSWGSAFVSTFGALAVVLGAFFALVALLKRTGASGNGGGTALEIVDSASVGDKARLLTIRWGNRLILAAKTPENIASLAEITDVDEANAMLAEIERRKENAALGKVGEKTAAIWKRGRDAANVWRTGLTAKGRR